MMVRVQKLEQSLHEALVDVSTRLTADPDSVPRAKPSVMTFHDVSLQERVHQLQVMLQIRAILSAKFDMQALQRKKWFIIQDFQSKRIATCGNGILAELYANR